MPKQKYFSCGNDVSIFELQKINPEVAKMPFDPRRLWVYKHIKAKRTGEFRPPRKGEWYLSGAIVTAYRAGADFTTSYHIAKLVAIETQTITIEREI